MRLLLNAFLIFLTLTIFDNKISALTDYQIREICRKSKKKLNCIKNLQIKKLNLLKGNRIEIPVIPFKD